MNRLAVPHMFDAISSRYDYINTILSLGLHHYWRKAVCRFVPNNKKIKLLDCATGTGDQLVSLFTHAKGIYDAVGIDPSEEMLNIGRAKLSTHAYQCKLIKASAEAIPFPDKMFDAVTISFGIRNVESLHQSLKEIHRVLSVGGRVVILEFSHPSLRPVRFLHRFYLNHIVPKVGSWLSQNKEAYTYLSKTIESFPQGEAFCHVLRQMGFSNVQRKPLSFGVVTIYIGEKK